MSRSDFAGVGLLWERIWPEPIYLGDEYAVPLVGVDELDRHWARLGARVKSATVTTSVHSVDRIGQTIRCVLLSRWRYLARGADTAVEGASWITWLLLARRAEMRIVHHMESQVHLVDEGFA